MTSTPDRYLPARRRFASALAVLALLCAGGPALSQSGSSSAAELIGRAIGDLDRHDGIAAEIRLKKALQGGAAKTDVAAYMGEALVLQGQNDKARYWLDAAKFSPQTSARGFRALARIERLEGNLPAAGQAYDRALATTPDDAALWVDIGRLRYTGMQHLMALDAAEHALKLEPDNVRALEFKGQIVRDQHGLRAALPWFEAALARNPEDISVLGEYAATLGDMGRVMDMLAVTRQMLTIDRRNPRALYLQAVMAARAGDNSLARSLLNRAGSAVAGWPGAMLLDAVIDLRTGSPVMAITKLEQLSERQPANARVPELLARALFQAGEYDALTRRFGPVAAQDGASPYMLTLVGRAYEILDRRDLAAPFLDRATRSSAFAIYPVRNGSWLGDHITSGRYAQAMSEIEQSLSVTPGAAPLRVEKGDMLLVRGDDAGALAQYRQAARVSLPLSLMLRMKALLERTGKQAQADALVENYLFNNPDSAEGAWHAAQGALSRKDWGRARLLLSHLDRTGSRRDVSVLTDLSLASLRAGDTQGAIDAAQRAYRLQRSSGEAAGALGLSLAEAGEATANARSLLSKARALMGDNELIAEGRQRLARR
jgi:tetratricopeptide (TPR) repeat protein